MPDLLNSSKPVSKHLNTDGLMLFQIPSETPYDLRFSIFGIPVRVHPLFWVVGLLLGWRDAHLMRTLAFVVCFFVSILVHELGHALSARRFGWPPFIVLYAFGGLACYQPSFGHTRSRAIWISFAGPLAGFMLAGVAYGLTYGWAQAIAAEQLWAVNLLDTEFGLLIGWMLAILVWINVVWGLLNLLPVHPLDGGQICYELCNARQFRSGQVRAHRIGTAAGILASAFSFANDNFIGGLMFAGLAYENYRAQGRLRTRI